MSRWTVQSQHVGPGPSAGASASSEMLPKDISTGEEEDATEYAPSHAMALESAATPITSLRKMCSCVAGDSEVKRTGTTLESAREQNTNSECSSRMCWYATRCGQR